MAKPMWTYDINVSTLIDNFSAAVETDTASKGSWQLDYEMFCDKFRVIPCPFIKAANLSADNESVKVINAIVDLSSWRAMLFACCVTGSKVVEICVHGARLEPQHLLDLSVALRKMGTCQSLKLQFIDWQDGLVQFQEGLLAVLNDAAGLEYISLKGNGLTDEIAAPLLSSLAQNFKLTILNLASNNLTDQSLRAFWKAVRCTSNLKMVSFESNQLTGESLSVLGETLMGSEYNAEDDAIFKGNAKLISERNKQIKETNKKRKKGGLVDLKELNASLECSVKKDKTTMLHANRTLRRIDLSHNLGLQVEQVNALAQTISDTPALAALPPAAAAASTDSNLVIDVTGSVALSVNFNFNPQAWAEFLV